MTKRRIGGRTAEVLASKANASARLLWQVEADTRSMRAKTNGSARFDWRRRQANRLIGAQRANDEQRRPRRSAFRVPKRRK
jgi:hypothetical protein